MKKRQMERSKTDLKEEILAVVWTTMMNHDELWLQYSLLVTQFNESRNRVLPCTRETTQEKMMRFWNRWYCKEQFNDRFTLLPLSKR